MNEKNIDLENAKAIKNYVVLNKFSKKKRKKVQRT